MSDGRNFGVDIPGEREGAGTILPSAGESRDPAPSSGPTWKGWAVSIIAAVILSVAATLLLGGWSSFGSPRAAGLSTPGGCGGPCCPGGTQPAGEGK